MEDRRLVADRDLRHLSTNDLLTLIRQDIRELDTLIATYRRPPREQKPSRQHRTAREAIDSAMPDMDEPEAMPMHAVTCCNHHMGDFPAIARVRCPFCSAWHKAGDSPKVS